MTTVPTRAQYEADKFSNWMKNKVKSVHYANNDKMSTAYQKVYTNFAK
jgi:hypothetical protein